MRILLIYPTDLMVAEALMADFTLKCTQSVFLIKKH